MALRLGLFGRLDGKGGRRAQPARFAGVGQGADQALRRSDGADPRPEIHHSLREIARALFGGDPRHQRTQPRAGLGQGLVEGEEPADDALDIGIDDDGASPEGDRGDGGRAILADAGQRPQSLFRVWKTPAMLRRDHPGAGEQIAGPRIIAEPRPGSHHVGAVGQGKVAHGRPARREPLEIGLHRRDGGLLQHRLGQPYPVRVGKGGTGLSTPGQAAAVDIVPGQQFFGDGIDGHGAPMA